MTLSQYGDASSLVDPRTQNIYSFGNLVPGFVNFTIPLESDLAVEVDFPGYVQQLVDLDNPLTATIAQRDRLDEILGRGLLLEGSIGLLGYGILSIAAGELSSKIQPDVIAICQNPEMTFLFYSEFADSPLLTGFYMPLSKELYDLGPLKTLINAKFVNIGDGISTISSLSAPESSGCAQFTLPFDP